MEDTVFPKNIQLGEYEFKFLTELEVERDSQGKVIAKTMQNLFDEDKNNDDKLEDFENGEYCFIRADRYNIENTNCIYFLITEDYQILNNIHSNKNFSISLFNNVKLSDLVISKTKTRNHGRQSFRRLNRLVCYMKEHNKKVSVYYTVQLDNNKEQLNNVIDYVEKSNIYPFYINLPELFERYCEVKLREHIPYLLAGYAKNDICSQIKTGALRPDFAIPKSDEDKIDAYILDSKYSIKYSHIFKKINKGEEEINEKTGDIKEHLQQLSLYSRTLKFQNKLCVDKSSDIKLCIIFPVLQKENQEIIKETENQEKKLLCNNYRIYPSKNYEEFYYMPLEIPCIKIM